MPTAIWKNGKAHLPKLEVHINNTCNLTCDNCDRFSNHNFTGVQKYKDYAEIIKQWSDCIVVDQVVILGGEPLLNPTLLDWLTALRNITSNPIQILSNGTRLNRVEGLYESLLPNKDWIGISWHNTQDESIFTDIKDFLKGDIAHIGPTYPEYGNETYLTDQNGVTIGVWLQNEFGLAAVHKNEKGKWSLWNNNPDEVHQGCAYYQHRSYNMIRGEIFKCAPVALMSEFDNQHFLDISNEDREIVHSYKSLKVQNFDKEATNFFNNIDNVLPNCKFCPAGWKHDPRIIYPMVKNTKVT